MPLLGKTKPDRFATGLVGTRTPHVAPARVFAAAHLGGGSRSGSSVLVGGARVPFSLGNDLARPGHVPAGFICVVGLTPRRAHASRSNGSRPR